jgi:hypothetical protein
VLVLGLVFIMFLKPFSHFCGTAVDGTIEAEHCGGDYNDNAKDNQKSFHGLAIK